MKETLATIGLLIAAIPFSRGYLQKMYNCNLMVLFVLMVLSLQHCKFVMAEMMTSTKEKC